MNRRMVKLTAVVLGCLYLSSCGLLGLDGCDSKMDDYRDKWGSPEEVTAYNSDGYHNEEWWYWSKGKNVGFTWGSDVSGCDVDTYTFTPIGQLKGGEE